MLSEYGDILSGEQVRRILHISKRKCAWLLNNGYIKCKNSRKKSRKYTVLKSDLIEFIEDSQRCPEKYVLPCGEFSSGSKNASIGVT
ncbi:MAG: helix-turn-helix domain-containing protein, partial [Spirochaetales bacterium]|nr:helix-turn-helix domain-containing protein [Spirochaetales bacterium]